MKAFASNFWHWVRRGYPLRTAWRMAGSSNGARLLFMPTNE